MNNIPTSETTALKQKDLELFDYKKNQRCKYKVAKVPIILKFHSLVVILLGLKNVVTVQNAINIGVGFSYDLNGMKNGTNVKIAQNRALELF
jgi:hypothetical protein